MSEAAERISAAARPVILAGVEIHRFGLQETLVALARVTGIPVASTISGKSVFPESNPAYLGVYEGAMGNDSTREYVEQSDCVILLGAMLTDINLGIYTARIERSASVYAARDRVTVGFRSYDSVRMEDFIGGLASRSWTGGRFRVSRIPNVPVLSPPPERRQRLPPCSARSTPTSMTI